MFETTYKFQEIPVTLGDVEVMMVTGTATLEGDIVPHDYGFAVTAIELDGNLDSDYRIKRKAKLEPGRDLFEAMLFHRIKNRIEQSKDTSDHFYEQFEREAA